VYRPTDYDRALPRLCTDATDAPRHSIPPPLIRRRLREVKAAARQSLLAPAGRRNCEAHRQNLLQAIFDLESAFMALGRVALLGDAAFVARRT